MISGTVTPFRRENGVYELNMKFRQAQVSGDFSIITDDDVATMIAVMGNIAAIWKSIMAYLTMYCAFPIAIFSKFVYC